MAIRNVGINQPWSCSNGLFGLAEHLESLKGHGADFVELMPNALGVILGGDLDPARLRIVQELLLEADLDYTVDAPLEVNLTDLSAHEVQRGVLEASIRFAGRVGAGVVVCHVRSADWAARCPTQPEGAACRRTARIAAGGVLGAGEEVLRWGRRWGGEVFVFGIKLIDKPRTFLGQPSQNFEVYWGGRRGGLVTHPSIRCNTSNLS